MEQCRVIDASRWVRLDILGYKLMGLSGPRSDALSSGMPLDLCYETGSCQDGPAVRLNYSLKVRMEALGYDVRLETTQSSRGSERWWFLGPVMVCERRAQKLYLPPNERQFGCRHCYRMIYERLGKPACPAMAVCRLDLAIDLAQVGANAGPKSDLLPVWRRLHMLLRSGHPLLPPMMVHHPYPQQPHCRAFVIFCASFVHQFGERRRQFATNARAELRHHRP